MFTNQRFKRNISICLFTDSPELVEVKLVPAAAICANFVFDYVCFAFPNKKNNTKTNRKFDCFG